jgi:hypothetical protein
MERRLAFDPTPESTALPLRLKYKYLWKLIRDDRFKTADYRCEICGSDRGKREWLDGHEVYSFPEPKVIRLERVIFICKHCHDATHLERTRLVSGKQWTAEVEAHYCRMNGIPAGELKSDYVSYCTARSVLLKTHPKYECVMDYGPWKAKCEEIDARWKARGKPNLTLDDLRIARMKEIEKAIADRVAQTAPKAKTKPRKKRVAK